MLADFLADFRRILLKFFSALRYGVSCVREEVLAPKFTALPFTSHLNVFRCGRLTVTKVATDVYIIRVSGDLFIYELVVGLGATAR